MKHLDEALEELGAASQEFIDEYEEEIELWITYGGDQKVEIEFLDTLAPMPRYKGERTRFKINDQEFEIAMKFMGNYESKLANLELLRIIDGKKISNTTKQSGHAIFRIFSFITDWYIECALKHQVKMAIVEGDATETGRLKIYDKMGARFAEACNYKVRRIIKNPKNGTPQVIFMFYDSEYLRNNPEYTQKLNKDLKKFFNMGYKIDTQGRNNE